MKKQFIGTIFIILCFLFVVGCSKTEANDDGSTHYVVEGNPSTNDVEKTNYKSNEHKDKKIANKMHLIKIEETNSFGDSLGSSYITFNTDQNGSYVTKSANGKMQWNMRIDFSTGCVEFILKEDCIDKSISSIEDNSEGGEEFTVSFRTDDGTISEYKAYLKKSDTFKMNSLEINEDLKQFLIAPGTIKVAIMGDNGEYILDEMNLVELKELLYDKAPYNNVVSLMQKGNYEEALKQLREYEANDSFVYELYNSDELLFECCSNLGLFAVGMKGPAGGYIFYDCDEDNESGNADGLISSECGWRYLEAAPEDLNSKGYVFSESNVRIKNTSWDIGTGKANTEKILEKVKEENCAARACYDYCYNGYDDWFLPSSYDLFFIEENLYNKGIGDLKNECYWSSSERNEIGSLYAYAWGIGNFEAYPYDKNITYCVRPIRAFSTCASSIDHNWDDGVIIKNPTCLNGEIVYTCKTCKTNKIEMIESTGIHNFENYKCSICGIWSKGPAGGYVFYDCDADNETGNSDGLISAEVGWRFLEASPEAITMKDMEFDYGEWGQKIGITSTAIGTGKKNTAELVDKLREEQNNKVRVVTSCVDYNINGYDDWFLPSLDELALIYTNVYAEGYSDLDYIDYPLYITSSESDSLSSFDDSTKDVWYIYFGNRLQKSHYDRQMNMWSIWPIRAFSLCTNNSEHTWNEGEITLPPTCSEIGEITYKCKKCGEVKTEIINKSEHCFENYKCTICNAWGRGPAEGWVFYDCDADNDFGNGDGLISEKCGWRFLEVADEEFSEYFKGKKNRIRTTSTEIGEGCSNTQQIINILGDGKSPAKLCIDYSYNGFDDWFLPSLKELTMIYQNLKLHGNVGFDYKFYISSSEYDTQNYWDLNFNTGEQGFNGSIDLYQAYLPIRAFL